MQYNVAIWANTKHNYRISSEVKEQVLKRIKEDGISVTQAAEEHGISTHTVYKLLTKTATNNPTWQEVTKLKKQNQHYFIIFILA